MATLVRQHDWSNTAMGAIDRWPAALRSIVSLILDTAFPMFVAWGPQLHTVYNDGYARIMGGKHPHGLGRPFLEIWDEIRHELQPFVDKVMGGETFYIENFPLRLLRNGTEESTWFTFSWSPVFDEQGRTAGIYCACTETTRMVLAERHVREERSRLAELFRRAPGFLAVLTGPEHRFEDVNDAYLRLIGFREVIGKPMALALPEVAEQGFVALLDRVYQTGEPFRGQSMALRLAPTPGIGGSKAYVDFVFEPMWGGDGAVEGILVQGHDVTEQFESQLALRDADRKKDEFLATLAHELRNPLAPMMNAVQLLSLPNAPEATRNRAAAVIGRQVRQMTRLLDDLIDISRITRKRMRLKPEMVTVGTLVDAAVEATEPLLQARRHTLAVRVANPAAQVKVDPVRITQVLTNLLNNAAKYTDAGGRIGLDAAVEGERLQFAVSDNGIGISAEGITRLFRMFEQDATALERSEGGLGIGLALARSLVELHGGTLQVASAGLGHGSRFAVSLPALQPDAETVAPASTLSRPHAAPRRVMLADDNADALEAMAEILRLDGHEVHTAGDGTAALALATKHQPEVLVLDIGMPGLNGYEVARRVRALPWPKRPYLVAASGWGQPEHLKASAEAGFDLHLTKPVDPLRLASLVAFHPVAG